MPPLNRAAAFGITANINATSQSFTTPRISGGLLDQNGNDWISVSAAASAVNYWQFGNAATGNAIACVAAGTDSNISVTFDALGTGTITLNGTATGIVHVGHGLTVDASGLTVTAGGLAVTAGGLTVTAGGAAIGGQATVTASFAPTTVTALGATGTVSVDPTLGNTFTQTPSGATTFNAASVINGQILTFVITTSGTTSYTLTFGTSFKSTGTLATGTTNGKVFTISFRSDGVNYNEISRTTAM